MTTTTTTTDTFTDAQGRRYIAGQEVPEVVWDRYRQAPRPDCGHRRLAECPLMIEDWRAVYYAFLGFMQTCRLIAEEAHQRQGPGVP